MITTYPNGTIPISVLYYSNDICEIHIGGIYFYNMSNNNLVLVIGHIKYKEGGEMIELNSGKLNIIIDGQFGSTGKGLLASYIGVHNHVDIAVTNASPNAGHTFYDRDDKKIVARHLPISGIINDRSLIYLCAGSIINPVILMQEIEELDLDPCRIVIHPRAAVISREDIELEQTAKLGVKRIASTMNGVGMALTRKINRTAKLACDTDRLLEFVKVIDLQGYMRHGCTVLMEVPQGLDLSLNHGLAYPYCTSRDITIPSAMNDAGVHPSYLGKVSVAIRTFPIRVGNVVENGKEVGNSGPFHEDSVETTWSDLKLEDEFTTCTKRVRRVATFSKIQYDKMIEMLRPDYVFLNFCNYLSRLKIDNMLERFERVTHVGFGPRVEDVLPVNR